MDEWVNEWSWALSSVVESGKEEGEGAKPCQAQDSLSGLREEEEEVLREKFVEWELWRKIAIYENQLVRN